MEAIQVTEANWFDDFDFNSQMEIMQELQEDNQPQFIISPNQQVVESKLLDEPYESIINKLISTVYSGPTISDIESALSVTNAGCNISNSLFGLSLADHKGLGKMDHKYTFKMKTSGNGLADDGYKWRKYGQKSIKNSPNPRSYYRCTNPRCNAKKQVERSMEEPEMLIITYEGLHLHYTYSHLLPAAPPDHCSDASLLPAAKKLKCQSTEDGGAVAASSAAATVAMFSPSVGDDDDGTSKDVIMQGSQGLLEDVVPLLVRRPCISTDSFSSSSSTASCSSLSWIATSSCVDHGVLSSIV